MSAVAEQRAVALPWRSAVTEARDQFVAIASKDQIVDWQRESMFALQALEKNDYLCKIANGNPASLRNAIINVAACGLTLSPASQYAALVPRDGAVCLDIMYRGLIKIATDAGSIRWVKAELVHSTDNFVYRGPVAQPLHEANVFAKDRGPVVGVYCVAKTVDGDLLTETMAVDEVNAIRDRSAYWKQKKAGPWATDWGEMGKKTVIKRARKTWPETKSEKESGRLAHAVELANIADGYHDDLGDRGQQQAAITPQGDAWSSQDEDQKAFLQGVADKCIAYLAAEQPDDAHAWIVTQKLNADEMVALWTRFDSKQRSALKKAATKAKAAPDA